MDVQRVLLLLRRWWPVLVVGTLLAAGASYAVSKAQPKVYEATAVLQVNSGLVTSGGGGDFNELQAASWIAATDAQLIKTAGIAQDTLARTAGKLQHPVDAGTLIKNTTATAIPQDTIINLTVRAASPHDAQLLAQAMADDFVALDNRKHYAGVDNYIATITQHSKSLNSELAQAQYQYDALLRQPSLNAQQKLQLGNLSNQISSDRTTLDQLQSNLSIAEVQKNSPGATTSVYQAAQASSTPVAPRTAVNVLIAAILVLLALLGIAVLTDLLDTRPRSADEIASLLDLPLAGTINAVRGRVALTAVHDPTAPATDAYRSLRATLGLTDEAEGAAPRALVVTGAASGNGATNVAANLAAVTARAGTRVVLVDANLRHPALHALFKLPEGAGLATLLRDGGDPAALLREAAVPGLRVLPAGGAAATAIDLLDSARMRTVLAALREVADLVVIDTGVATLPETAALARLSDLTLLVARLHDGDRAALTTAAERLRLAGAPLGAVAVTDIAGSGVARGVRRPLTAPLADHEQPAATSARLAK